MVQRDRESKECEVSEVGHPKITEDSLNFSVQMSEISRSKVRACSYRTRTAQDVRNGRLVVESRRLACARDRDVVICFAGSQEFSRNSQYWTDGTNLHE